MRMQVLALIAALSLAACGVDGAPTYTASTQVGFNSNSGAYNNTSLGVNFGG